MSYRGCTLSKQTYGRSGQRYNFDWEPILKLCWKGGRNKFVDQDGQVLDCRVRKIVPSTLEI